MLYQLSYASDLERETGIEPATNSLEGCDSTIELLPQNPLQRCFAHNGLTPVRSHVPLYMEHRAG